MGSLLSRGKFTLMISLPYQSLPLSTKSIGLMPLDSFPGLCFLPDLNPGKNADHMVKTPSLGISKAALHARSEPQGSLAKCALLCLQRFKMLL